MFIFDREPAGTKIGENSDQALSGWTTSIQRENDVRQLSLSRGGNCAERNMPLTCARLWVLDRGHYAAYVQIAHLDLQVVGFVIRFC